MSTSETKWQVWLPDDLLSEMAEQRTPPSLMVTEAMSDMQQDAELSGLRQQAEQRGFAQGLAQGIEEGKKQGYDSGFQHGKEEGFAQGLAESKAQQQQQLAQFTQWLDSFQTELDNLNSAIPSRLVQVALTATRAMFGEQIASGSTNTFLLDRIQHLLREENLQQGKAKLWISAEEPETIREQLGNILYSRGWELGIDTQMLPGGCRITTDEGELDATTEARWQSLCNLNREDFLP